ncbi:hypothetical protein RE0356_27920 [Prescottella equi]|nr:hypothetical protein RE0356_27920 [Prescottella equi]
MDHEQEPSGPIRPDITPHGLHHPARRRVEPSGGVLAGSGENTGEILLRVDRDPVQHIRCRDVARRRHLEPRGFGPEPRPEHVVVVDHGLQRTAQIGCRDPHRQRHTHGLRQARPRSAAFDQPAHDGRRRHVAHPASRQLGEHLHRVVEGCGGRGEAGHREAVEHVAGRQGQTGLAGPRHQLDRHDRVAAQREERVVGSYRLDPEDLHEQPRQRLLDRTGGRATRTGSSPEIRFGQRLPIDLPVDRER